jgi:RNA polymerase sigma-70 factor, ECF subfamily
VLGVAGSLRQLYSAEGCCMSSETATYFSNALPDAMEIASPAFESASTTHTEKESQVEICATDRRAEGPSDEHLLIQVSQGSKDALSILFQRHARQVFNVARRILRDDAEAEDLLQDFFLFLFRKAGMFDAKKSSAVSWIIQIAYHRALDRRRYLTLRQHYSLHELNDERQHTNVGHISVDDVAGRALLEKLRGELSQEQRQTLELHFFEGYTFHEIAERTGQGFGNVRHHYYRGLERLRSFVFPGKMPPK